MTKFSVLLIDDIGKMQQNKWYETLDHCPSQCYYYAVKKGVNYILYLRWRWEDPWEGYIIKNAFDKVNMGEKVAEWSEDAIGSFEFEHDDYKKAQKMLLDIFRSAK